MATGTMKYFDIQTDPEKEPFRVTFTGRGINISGSIKTPEDADDLVRAVNALKLLLKPVSEIGCTRRS